MQFSVYRSKVCIGETEEDWCQREEEDLGLLLETMAEALAAMVLNHSTEDSRQAKSLQGEAQLVSKIISAHKVPNQHVADEAGLAELGPAN